MKLSTEYNNIKIAENYRGSYLISSWILKSNLKQIPICNIKNKAINGYGDCTIGSFDYFLNLVLRSKDYKVTKAFIDIYKTYCSTYYHFKENLKILESLL